MQRASDVGCERFGQGYIRFKVQSPHLKYGVSATSFCINSSDQLAADKNWQREVAVFAFRPGCVALDAIVKIEHPQRTFAIPNQWVERREQGAIRRAESVVLYRSQKGCMVGMYVRWQRPVGDLDAQQLPGFN